MLIVAPLHRPSRRCPMRVIAVQPRFASDHRLNTRKPGLSRRNSSAGVSVPIRPSARVIARNRAETPETTRASRISVATHRARLATYSTVLDSSSTSSQSTRSPATPA
ncbi:hypothetical protein [Streptosporangium sp. H16]|uniref:hypothetical protein n=1 Tax=Streptosporangium sp. H16 TaxID=3444184 RepID=UPI003F79F39C